MPRTGLRGICHAQGSQGIKNPGYITPSEYICSGIAPDITDGNAQQEEIDHPCASVSTEVLNRGNGSDGGSLAMWNIAL